MTSGSSPLAATLNNLFKELYLGSDIGDILKTKLKDSILKEDVDFTKIDNRMTGISQILGGTYGNKNFPFSR